MTHRADEPSGSPLEPFPHPARMDSLRPDRAVGREGQVSQDRAGDGWERRMNVRTCPVCSSERVIIILRDERKGLCYDCGSQWLETIIGERTIVAVPERPSGTQRRQSRSDR
jgi:hypothetical protein